MSNGAFLDDSPLKPAPGIRGSASSLRHPSHASAVARSNRGSKSTFVHASACRCARGLPLSTPGVLGSGPSCVVSVHLSLLRPHPPVSQAHRDFTAPRLIRDAFAVRERLGDPRDLPYFRCRAFHACRRPYAGGSTSPSRYLLARRYQASSPYQRVATHNTRLCQQFLTGLLFRRCIVRLMLRPARLPGPPGWLRRRGATVHHVAS